MYKTEKVKMSSGTDTSCHNLPNFPDISNPLPIVDSFKSKLPYFLNKNFKSVLLIYLH